MMRCRNIALLLFAALVGLEIVLQLAGLWSTVEAIPPPDIDKKAPVILCLGDSHTYGVFVAPEETYPARLQAVLRESGYRVNVLNLGVPGASTAQIRRRLPELLAAFQPVAVLVWAAVNDHWNRADASWADGQDGVAVPWSTRAGEFLRTRVQVIRGLHGLLRGLGWVGTPVETAGDRLGRELVHERAADWEAQPVKPTVERALRNLEAIVRMVRLAHAQPLVLTYAAPSDDRFAWPNRTLRAVAGYLEAPVLDNDRLLRPRLTTPDGAVDPAARDTLLLPDLHATAAAYDLIARNAGLQLIRSGLANRLPLQGLPGGRLAHRFVRSAANELERFVPEVRLLEEEDQPAPLARQVPLLRLTSPFDTPAVIAQDVPRYVWGHSAAETARRNASPLFSGRISTTAGVEIPFDWEIRFPPLTPPSWHRTTRGGLALEVELAGGHLAHFRVQPRDRYWEVRFGWTNGSTETLTDVVAEIATQDASPQTSREAVLAYTPSTGPETTRLSAAWRPARPRLGTVAPGETRWAASYFLFYRGDVEELRRQLSAAHVERFGASPPALAPE